MKRIYLAGPCTGLPDSNYPAFNREAARLRALGYSVENPADNPEQDSWSAYLRISIRQMLTCDTIAVLPNWSQSKGAKLEVMIAGKCGLRFCYASDIQAPINN